MSWPGADPYYEYSKSDGDPRKSQYGVSWVPFMIIDGKGDLNDLEGTWGVNDWETRILNNTSLTAPLEINLKGRFDEVSGAGNCVIELIPEAGVSGRHNVYVVLIEDSLYYAGTNGFPHHQNVMRHMFPDAKGTEVNLEAGVTTTAQVSFFIPAEVDRAKSRLIVIVQNPTREVLNAAEVKDVTELPLVYMPLLSSMSSDLQILDDDGDGKLNPGESASYTVTIENHCDWLDATDVVGYLSSSSPYVTITDGVGAYGSIDPCSFAVNSADQFTFAISEDAPAVSNFEFALRLTANNGIDLPYVPYETILPFTISMDLFQNHFPIKVKQPIYGGNAAVDLDGDGMKEIIIGGADSLLHAYTLDGSELDGFPFAADQWIFGAPAVADIDGDTDLEIVVTSLDKHIYVIQHDGSGVAIAEAAGFLWGTPTLVDLDDDGDLEIIVAGSGQDLLVMHHDGTPLSGFPITISGEPMFNSVAVADLDADGSLDIVVGTLGKNLHAFDLTGNSIEGFPVPMLKGVFTSPVVADLEGDGKFEILVGQDDGIFFAISNTGDTLWTKQLSAGSIRTAAAVLDFNHDGLLEIVITTLDGLITMLDFQGNELDGWPNTLGIACYSSPVIADLDGDEIPEILVGSNSSELNAFHIDGSIVENFPIILSSPARGTPTVDDINQDGDLEIIIGTDYDLSVINLKVPSVVDSTWFTARGNYQRTGFLVNPIISSVDGETNIPYSLRLKQNYPNPFNPSTNIEFTIPMNSRVSLIIYDVLGQEVIRLVNSDLSMGSYSLQWNGQDASGRAMDTGIYFSKLSAAGGEKVMKMLLIK